MQSYNIQGNFGGLLGCNSLRSYPLDKGELGKQILYCL